MSNPFKKISENAKKTKAEKQWKNAKDSSEIGAITCRNCGAPRPKDTDIRKCEYCGYEFMSIDSPIKIST